MNSVTVQTEIYPGLLVFLGMFIYVVDCQTFDLNYYIDEEVPVNSVVGNIGTDSSIFQLLSAEDFASLRYRILLYPESHNNYFTIVNTTGVLKTAATIDRELLCFYEITCKLNVHVAAQTESGQQFYTFKVVVFVKDINDNSPTFSMPTMTVKIDEDASVATTIPIISATDRDILNNTLQKYTLVTQSDVFGLRVTRNLDESLTPQLYVKSLLDRERQSRYYLKILALDGGTPARSGELSINVTLNDINDNAPRFSKQVYDESVPEVSPIGHRVMTLSATDEDIGNNGRVTFSLGARQSEESFNTFRVVANTGDILSLRDLTPLQGQTMRLVVEAVDQGIKPLTAQAVVNIHILDSVNNPPVIRMTIPPGSPVSRVMENSSPGFVVAHFVVEDDDSGENGEVTCQLQGDTFGLQRLKKDEYKVTVYSTLDRERMPFFDVTITCMDGGSPTMTTNVAFSVILEDANDNPPKFLKYLYMANVSENINSFILRLEAEDIDMGQNGSVSYRLGDVTPLVASYIYVNPTTGEVSTKQMLDHELFKQLDFQVIAADSGSPSLSSTARVIINVIDQNDNTPRVPSGYYLSVPENKPIGTVVGVIHAIDPDEGASGEVGYQLRSDNEAFRPFNLSKSGEIRTLQIFDREEKSVYGINVLAWDYGENPLTNDLHIRIMIADDNDNAPVLEFPRPGNKTVHTTLDARYNTTITYVLATDQDSEENASLTFALVDGGRGVFDIDPRVGRVYTTRTLQPSDKGTYTITVSVRDNGPQPKFTMGALIILVTQGNGTAAYYTSLSNNEHIIIAAILVGITIFIAIVVLLIVIRFLKKERQDRRPKYTGGLPMEVKMRTAASEDEASVEDDPWRRYDAAKRPTNGPVMTGEVAYEGSDEILMFKLKLADQYKELEPDDKDHGSHILSPEDSFNTTSEGDGAPEVNRHRSTTRLATFQARPGGTLGPSYGGHQDHKDKVWQTALKEKIADEILSSSSRETTGADSGKGPSEDGSQGRSSITDDSICLTSPSHSLLRGRQTNYSRPHSGTGYDPPPLLMTFQSNSSDHPTNGSSIYLTRKECGYISSFPSSPSQRQQNGYGQDYPQKHSAETVYIGERDITVHRNELGDSPEPDNKDNTLKKLIVPNNFKAVNGTKKHVALLNRQVKATERSAYSPGKMNDVRLCSEPPSVAEYRDKGTQSYSKRGIQETGQTTTPAHLTSSIIMSNASKPAYGDPSPSTKNRHMYPNSPRFLQTPYTPNSLKQTADLQHYQNDTSFDQHSQTTLPVAGRTGAFKNLEKPLEVLSKSIQDRFNRERDAQDDCNSSTTSGSYSLEAPQTDVFI